jgi:hypothetical protein
VQLLQDAAGALRSLPLEEKMKVLGHGNPTDQQEAQQLAELAQHVHRIAPEARAFKSFMRR